MTDLHAYQFAGKKLLILKIASFPLSGHQETMDYDWALHTNLLGRIYWASFLNFSRLCHTSYRPLCRSVDHHPGEQDSFLLGHFPKSHPLPLSFPPPFFSGWWWVVGYQREQHREHASLWRHHHHQARRRCCQTHCPKTGRRDVYGMWVQGSKYTETPH